MSIAITKGVKIMVETFYQPQYSDVDSDEFMFAYRITITNDSIHTLQLMSRHWYIYELLHPVREVVGDGVVGQQPIIYPGESYQYMSGCSINSEIGKMKGTYQMRRLNDGQLFEVTIPEFSLCTPQKSN
jgi:ApaG protein